MRTFRIWLLLFVAAHGVVRPANANVSGIDIDVRTTGNDGNGGGYANQTLTSSQISTPACTGGTDFSQSDTAHVTFNGTTVTATTVGAGATITITGYTVITGDKCNVLQITGGVNYTASFYLITSVSTGANTWTLDHNVTTGAGTAMTGAMGGALATPAQANAAAIALGTYNHVHIKTGTYTFTTTPFAYTSPQPIGLIVEGYGAAHGDMGTKPLITTATNSIKLATFTSSSDGAKTFRNLSLSNTAGTRAEGFFAPSSFGAALVLDTCILDGFSYGVRGDLNVSERFVGLQIINTEIKNSTVTGILNDGNTYLYLAYIHDNTGYGLDNGTQHQPFTYWSVNYSVFASNTIDGIRFLGTSGLESMSVDHSAFYKNGVAGINWSSLLGGLTLTNNVFDQNTTFGLGGSNAPAPGFFNRNNAYYLNTTAARSPNWAGSSSTGDVTLTAEPFTTPASGVFTANSTAGGGAALKGAGYPGASILGTGGSDIGPLQSVASAGGSSNSAYVQ